MKSAAGACWKALVAIDLIAFWNLGAVQPGWPAVACLVRLNRRPATASAVAASITATAVRAVGSAKVARAAAVAAIRKIGAAVGDPPQPPLLELAASCFAHPSIGSRARSGTRWGWRTWHPVQTAAAGGWGLGVDGFLLARPEPGAPQCRCACLCAPGLRPGCGAKAAQRVGHHRW